MAIGGGLEDKSGRRSVSAESGNLYGNLEPAIFLT